MSKTKEEKKELQKIRDRNAYLKNKNNPAYIIRKKEASERWRERNRKKISEKSKIYKKNNRNIINITQKKWREKNSDKISKYRKKEKEYYFKNKHKIHIRKSEYGKKNRDKINSKRVAKFKSDINLRLLCSLRARFHYLLRNKNKFNNTIKLLGCSIPDLKKHLESKFTEGMNWENYGEWHIDHIIPCSVFDFTKIEAQIFCFHYTNMQPMWGKENKSKNCRVDIKLLEKIDKNLLKEKYRKLIESE